jgi:hypothetical protein
MIAGSRTAAGLYSRWAARAAFAAYSTVIREPRCAVAESRSMR